MSEKTIFQSAIAITDNAERAAFLDKACAGNPQLRTEVEALLKSLDAAGSFLETPAVAQAAAPVMPTIVGLQTPPTEADALGFLAPSATPGSLGRLGHYEVQAVLGRGAFGTVLKAFDERLHRVVAIKVMNAELAATSPPRKRFLREARSSASVRHENIVAIHAVEEQPIPYLVMEYIPGMTLQQRLDQQGPLDVAEVLRIGQQIAAGLAAAHAQGLIHRDIKPANILIETGLDERAKITDFGLARAADDASLTQSGLIAGTPLYMAPEQAKGQPLDHRADLFSLGSVLYTMVSGRPPFRAPNTIAVLKRVCEDTPRPITEVIAGTPPWLCDIIGKLLAKEPDDRFQSAREVSDVLGRCAEDLRLQRPVAVSVGHAFSTRVPPAGVSDTGPKSSWSNITWQVCVLGVLGAILVMLMMGDLGFGEARANTIMRGWGYPEAIIVFMLGSLMLFVLWLIIRAARGGSTTRAVASSSQWSLTAVPLAVMTALLVGAIAVPILMGVIGGPEAIILMVVFSLIAILTGRKSATAPAGSPPADAPQSLVAANPQLKADTTALKSLRGPGIGLVITACLNIIDMIGLLLASYIVAKRPGEELLPIGSNELWMLLPIVAAGSGVILLGGLSLLNGRKYGLCMLGCIAALFVGPMYAIGWPVAIWGLIVLNRPEVRDALARQVPARPVAAQTRSSPATVLLALVVGLLALPIIGGVLVFFSVALPAYFAVYAPIPKLPAQGVTGGLRFDGKDDYVKVDGLDWSYPQFTLEAFVTSANDGDNGVIAMLYSRGEKPEAMFLFDGPASSQQRLSGAGVVGQKPFGNAMAPLSTGVRQHRALVFDGQVLHYYVNGVWQGKRYNTAKVGLQWQINNLLIGCKSTDTEFFRGIIDQVRVSRVVRYTENFPPVTSLAADETTLALYNFDEGTGDVLHDTSGHGHDGKIFGAKWVTPKKVDSPTQVRAGWHGWPADAPAPAVAPFDAAAAKAHQEAWAKHLGVPVEYTNSIGMKFRLIPPGEFLMGSTAEEIDASLKEALAVRRNCPFFAAAGFTRRPARSFSLVPSSPSADSQFVL